jgi:hypothetical protein
MQWIMLRKSALAVLGFALVCQTGAYAQSVFKCVNDGKTTYQSSPCANKDKGTAVPIHSGPSAQEILEAQNRAKAEAARSSTLRPQIEQSQQPRQFLRPGTKPVDCEKLASEYGSAYGIRNGALRNARANPGQSDFMVKSQDDAIINAENRIRQIESEMQRSGCKKPD